MNKQSILPNLLWRVSPEEPRDTRPLDCYDIVDWGGMETVTSITFDMAQEIVNVHNKAMEEWANGN